ncbi:amidohydrolase [Baekduia soli]|uniref:Amidohydrolase n=1 Tax=Baekduia soli TaxID=496014 RepID=A0A5B8TZK6_9ACTN|nr:amidohydrolase family protein [Baekduia soli]QEC46160.1 amidohydrolase [Baekduia soli]
MPAVAPDRPDLLGTPWTGAVIDADLHVNPPSLEAIRPYLARQWLEWIDETGFTAPASLVTKYPPGSSVTCAARWRPADGRTPASDLGLLQEHVLDPLGVERAVISCYWGQDAIRNPDFAAALARAMNDWLVDEWLDRDPRLRATAVVPSHNPADAAAEIDRVGGHPGFVQVFLPLWSPKLYGNRIWLPLFEAIERHDLVAGLHYGGSSEGATTGTGWATWFLEEYVSALGMCWQQLTSMICEGLFQRYPTLRVSLLETGFTWLAPFLWRLDKEWKGLRREVPWVDRLPSDIFREHVKVAVQPIGAGPSPDDLARHVEWLGSDEILMFGSDYPHGHEHPVATLLDVLPEAARAKVMAGNARAHYKLGDG